MRTKEKKTKRETSYESRFSKIGSTMKPRTLRYRQVLWSLPRPGVLKKGPAFLIFSPIWWNVHVKLVPLIKSTWLNK